MARRKKRRSRRKQFPHGGAAHLKRRRKSRKAKGHVPLKILEKRLVKLDRLVKRRGGSSFS